MEHILIWLYYILLSYSFYRGIRGSLKIISSYNYIKSESTSINKSNLKKKIKFHILIPVLREQEVVGDTIKNFSRLKGNYQVYLITTGKEDFEKFNSNRIPLKYKAIPTTKRVIEMILDANPKLKKKFKIIHYSKTFGTVAYQYNCALKHLSKFADPNNFVLVYNADSVIENNVLEKYSEMILNNKDCMVIQQSAAFLANYKKLSPFLRSIALLQTRWTLAHEIPRILTTNGFWGFTEGAHLVAHGLCINFGFINQIGGFPQKFLSEDLTLGYFVRLYGAKIYLLKNLENADTPTSVKSMFNQYRTWFYALLFYPNYVKEALHNPKFEKCKVVLWGLKYYIRGLLWFGLSTVWLLIFIMPFLLNKPWLFILSFASFLIYAPLGFLFIFLTLGKDFGIRIDIPPILFSPVTYLTHSIGPWMAVYDLLRSKILKTNIYKHKTER